MIHALHSILLATRPKTLPAGLVAVVAGCVVVHKFSVTFPQLHISVNYQLAVFTAISCMCIQIACNLFNDALDAGHHADTAHRQGPLRITAGGRMSARSVKTWAAFFLILASTAAIPLVQAQGMSVILIGIPCLICAYTYTGGPYPIAYHGLGELFVFLFFGLVAVIGTVFVQIGWQSGYEIIYSAATMVGAICGLLSCVLIEVNNIRDRAEDATTGKCTLAVRLGDKRARGLAMAFLVAPYAVLHQLSRVLPGVGWNWFWVAALLTGGIILHRLMHTPADKRMNVLLGLSSLHLALYISALMLG